MKAKILVEIDKQNMPEEVTDYLEPYADIIYTKGLNTEHLKDTVAVIVETSKLDGKFLKKAPKLKIMTRFWVSYDSVDVEECTKHRVYVTHIPGVLSSGVADHTWALILGFMIRIPEADSFTRKTWEKKITKFPFDWEMEKKSLDFSV